MEYEVAEGYPKPEDYKLWGVFGYPAECLNRATNTDDPVGYAFYFSRYFHVDSPCLVGDSPIQVAASRGAVKCVEWLITQGAKDSTRSASELRTMAKKAAEKKTADQQRQAA